MARVVALFNESKEGNRNPLYLVRREYGLKLAQAASALGISSTQLEREERKQSCQFDLESVNASFELFAASSQYAGKNLVFGVLPLRVAREIMGISVDEMARRYSFSPSHWRKLECHARDLPVEVVRRIENDVKASFQEICDIAPDG